MTTPHPETASFADFARIARFKRSYVTQLKGDGRLVLTEDGKKVRVAESLQRIEDTRDPTRAAVAARHAASRAPAAAAEPTPGDEPAAPAEPEPATSGYTYWRERTERAKALAAERDNQVAEGKLMLAAEVESAISAAVTMLRAGVERLADLLAPQLAAISDESQTRAIIADNVEHQLSEMSRQFNSLAKGTT